MGYNMKGFSGFQSSPMKQTKQVIPTRQDSINVIHGKIESLEEDFFNEKVSEAEYNKRMAILSEQEDKIVGGKPGKIKDTNRPR